MQVLFYNKPVLGMLFGAMCFAQISLAKPSGDLPPPPPPVSPAASSSSTQVPSQANPQATKALPIKPSSAPLPEAKKPKPALPIQLSIEPTKGIYTLREGLSMTFWLTALEPTTVCLAPDPMSQFRIEVFRSGQGKLPIQPVVLQDSHILYQQPLKVVPLRSGQRYPLRLNLRRLQFNQGVTWTPGDYRVNATFSLCRRSPNASSDNLPDVDIPSTGAGKFFIMQ